MKLKIGVLGAGSFSKCFIPLFQAHPYVDEVVLAEHKPERLEQYARVFGLKHTFNSLEDMLKSDVDAVAIFSQRHLHGPQTLQALKAGKHVYSAVPMAASMDEVEAIVTEVASSGLIYMTGETSYYYPNTILCRNKFNAGEFGHFVYGEAQYLHDMSHGFYDAFKRSGGADWKKVAGFPPMYYPTHSASMILSVTGARAMKISCFGYVDNNEDGIFRLGGNLWDNPFSNETALIRTSDGGSMRLNEFRRVGWSGPNSVYLSMFGTEGSYEEHAGGSAWTTLEQRNVIDVTGELKCRDAYVRMDELEANLHESLKHDFNSSLANVHNKARLPGSFDRAPNGHFGSHQFLVDDFLKSVKTNKLPPNHVWNAARYLVPGFIAHESAKRDGELLEIPDFGDAPAHWDLLAPESFQAK